MRKQITKLTALMLLGGAISNVQAEGPSVIFNQEMGYIAEKGAVHLELIGGTMTVEPTVLYSAHQKGYAPQIRIGAFGGELHFNTNNRMRDNIGFKYGVMDNLAVYGQFAYVDDSRDETLSMGFDGNGDPIVGEQPDKAELAIGTAYTLPIEDIALVNANAELTSVNGNATIFIKAAGFYQVPGLPKKQNLLVGLEMVAHDIDDQPTYINIGARWMPTDRLTMDFFLYQNMDPEDIISIPNMVRLNLKF